MKSTSEPLSSETRAEKGKTGRPVGRPSRLLDWQASYIHRAWKIRRALSNKSIAKTLGISVSAVKHHTNNLSRNKYRARIYRESATYRQKANERQRRRREMARKLGASHVG